MSTQLCIEATKYLKGLKRISSVEESVSYLDDVLLLPENIDVSVDLNCNIIIEGNDDRKEIKARDLLRIIRVDDARNLEYTETNILSPSEYIHSLQKKPWHITTQGFLVTHISSKTKKYIEDESKRVQNYYGKHKMDAFWLPCSKRLKLITEEDLVCIFNRRISGWDGSIQRPVIELLGAGGHLQAVWDNEKKCFNNRTLVNNLKKEFAEEIGLELSNDNINFIGGFLNNSTQELVALSCVYIDEKKVSDIQKFALNNLKEDTDGIYLGTFKETIQYYRKDPSFFAGGEKAAKTNFPNKKYIIDRICEMYLLDYLEEI